MGLLSVPIAALLIAPFFCSASAVSLGAQPNFQFTTQSASACTSATLDVAISLSKLITVSNIPASCLGKTLTIKLGASILASAVTLNIAVTGSSSSVAAPLTITLAALTGAQLFIDGWYIKTRWLGITL